MNNRIVLSRPDAQRLRAVLAAYRGSYLDQEHLSDLHAEVEQARILDEAHMTADIVTIGSQVRVRDSGTGTSGEYVLVLPDQVELRAGHISVLAPLGTALLGYREGDNVEWQMPGGLRRLRIEKVRQPERKSSEREADRVN